MLQTFFFPSYETGQPVFAREWLPEPQAPRAILLLAHGMAEHTGRYGDFAGFLSRNGILVAGCDHLGHGQTARTPAELGYFSDGDGWEALVENLHALRQKEEAAHPGLPVFVLGHSMGSFVTRNYLIRHGDGLAGALLSGTGQMPMAAVRAGQVVAAAERAAKGPRHPSALLDSLCFGSYNRRFAPARTRFDWLSRDNASVDAYMADPLCGFVLTVSAFQSLFTGLCRIREKAALRQIPHDLPVFFFSGTDDPVGGYGRGVQKAAHALREAGLTNVQVRLYEGGRHEMLNEINREQVYQDVLTWLQKRLAERETA